MHCGAAAVLLELILQIGRRSSTGIKKLFIYKRICEKHFIKKFKKNKIILLKKKCLKQIMYEKRYFIKINVLLKKVYLKKLRSLQILKLNFN